MSKLNDAFKVLDAVDDTRRTEAFHLINAALLNLKFTLDKFTEDERKALGIVIKEIGEKTIEKTLKNETALSFGFGDENFSPVDYAIEKCSQSTFATELIKSVKRMTENAVTPVQSDTP